MIVLFLLNVLVYQRGDTLLFTVQDSVIDQWILGETVQKKDSLIYEVKKFAKISENHDFFFIYEEHYEGYRLTHTKIGLYDGDKNGLWVDSTGKDNPISFRLSNLYDSLLILVVTDENGRNPMVYMAEDKGKQVLIKKGKWRHINTYVLSANHKYLVFHNLKPYARKLWDYILFIDLENNTNWEYILPMCLTCKRGRLALHVKDDGEVEAIYKTEHRIFSKEGHLIDFFYSGE